MLDSCNKDCGEAMFHEGFCITFNIKRVRQVLPYEDREVEASSWVFENLTKFSENLTSTFRA